MFRKVWSAVTARRGRGRGRATAEAAGGGGATAEAAAVAVEPIQAEAHYAYVPPMATVEIIKPLPEDAQEYFQIMSDVRDQVDYYLRKASIDGYEKNGFRDDTEKKKMQFMADANRKEIGPPDYQKVVDCITFLQGNGIDEYMDRNSASPGTKARVQASLPRVFESKNFEPIPISKSGILISVLYEESQKNTELEDLVRNFYRGWFEEYSSCVIRDDPHCKSISAIRFYVEKFNELIDYKFRHAGGQKRKKKRKCKTKRKKTFSA
jgi:hypothetical protein